MTWFRVSSVFPFSPKTLPFRFSLILPICSVQRCSGTSLLNSPRTACAVDLDGQITGAGRGRRSRHVRVPAHVPRRAKLQRDHADECGRSRAALPRDRPAAVLLDVVMPGSMDGLAALAAFKKIDKDVPIIVISGQGRTSVVVQAMRLGATDFLCKPFEEAELEMVLEKALRQHQLSREVATLRAQLQSRRIHDARSQPADDRSARPDRARRRHRRDGADSR